jgi:predicted nuclease with RNAse H fold
VIICHVPCWIGVDVGGKRKGFDVAIVDERSLLLLAGGLNFEEVVRHAQESQPTLIGIDSPCCWAPDGENTRDCERALNRSVCGIRWTPDRHTGAVGDYYAWVREGLSLYTALQPFGFAVAEVFPTASWTRWIGPRGRSSRAKWSRSGLASLQLEGVPVRTNQDQRDAIAAAVTVRQDAAGLLERFGEIVVPVAVTVAR